MQLPTKTSDLVHFLASHSVCTMIEVRAARGSTPRDYGTWMLVAQGETFGTIGGGQLEYLAIDKARQIIKHGLTDPTEMHIPLGPDIGQCCGGSVELSIRSLEQKERSSLIKKIEIEQSEQADIYIFGAGHVGLALAELASFLPFNVRLIDTRETELHAAPKGVKTTLTTMPESIVRAAKPKSAFVILTHDHALDFIIAREAILLNNAAYIGMVGSKTKRATFKSWLTREEGSTDGFEQLTCPIGGNKVKDKRPEIIAALTCAELIAHLHGCNDPDYKSSMGSKYEEVGK